MNKVSFKKSTQAGFTLIELIVVIVILGIMAATALPKFTDVGADARVAKMNAARAAIMSVMAAAEGACRAQNKVGSSDCDLIVDGTKEDMTFGYPDADDIKTFAGLGDYHEGTTKGVISADSEHTGCAITYTEAADATTKATVSAAPSVEDCK